MKKAKKSRLDRVLVEVKEWAEDNWPTSDRLAQYISGAGNFPLANADLAQFVMLEFSKGLLAAEAHQMKAAKIHMAFGFERQLLHDLMGINERKGSSEVIIGSLDSVTHAMFGAIATGKPGFVRPFYDVVRNGMLGAYGVHDGHNPPIGSTLRYAAFGLSIIADWLEVPLDLDKHALPRDPAWGQLVAQWREPSPDKLLPILLSACDTHIERIAITEREANQQSEQFEFNSVFLAVHPTEILAVLRLRDLLGLANPTQIDHPLMQTPYAAITSRPGEVTERDELLERYLATVRQRDPQMLPAGL